MTSTITQEFRLKCRSNNHSINTSGCCPGFAQGNLIVLPQEVARDFEALCFRNPVPCPLLTKTPLGDSLKVEDENIIECSDFDLTRDLPRYNVYEKGKLIASPYDIRQYWTKDHVGFIIGCSFSFENELCKNNLTPKHQLTGRNVSMYYSSKQLDTSGIFTDCPYVVSMRPYKTADVEKVRDISRAFRKTHGEPIDWGMDAIDRLGINDITKPDFGDPTTIEDDEIPIFWGCGVTPQAAVERIGANIPGKILSHYPGHMLVLDCSDEDVKKL